MSEPETETTTIQVNVLAEKINDRMTAQIEAHERYSLAFIEIIKALDHIKDKLNSTSVADQEVLHELIDDVGRLSMELRFYHENAKEIRTGVEDKIDENNATTRAFLQELMLQRSITEELSPALKNVLEKLADINKLLTCIGSECSACAKRRFEHEEIVREHIAPLKTVADQVNALHSSRMGLHKWWERLGWSAVAAFAIWGIAEALTSFGVMHIDWFPKLH